MSFLNNFYYMVYRNMDLFQDSEGNDFDAMLAEMEREMSMADILKELGYGCTVDVSQCKEILSLFLPLTEVTISKILGTIACTHAGLEDNQNTFSTFSMVFGCNSASDLPSLNGWNIDVLIDTIQLLVSVLLVLLCRFYFLNMEAMMLWRDAHYCFHFCVLDSGT